MGKGTHKIFRTLKSVLRRLRSNGDGQDLIEYAMLAGFMAVAAAAVMPTNVGTVTSVIFSRLNASLVYVGTNGS